MALVVGAIMGGASLLMGGMGMSASKKAAKASLQAAKFNASILEGNADEVLRVAKQNALYADYNYGSIRNIGEYNEGLRREDASVILQRGLVEKAEIEKQGMRLAGTQLAGYGFSNIGLSGSAHDVIMDSAITNELDATTALYNAMRESDAMNAEAENIRMNTEMDLFNLQTQKTQMLEASDFEAENLKKQAKLEVMSGQARSSSLKSSGNAQFLQGIQGAAKAYGGYKAGKS